MKDQRGRFVQDQKVLVTARGRHLSVGRLLPDDWLNVRVTKTKQTDSTIWVRLVKLEITEA